MWLRASSSAIERRSAPKGKKYLTIGPCVLCHSRFGVPTSVVIMVKNWPHSGNPGTVGTLRRVEI